MCSGYSTADRCLKKRQSTSASGRTSCRPKGIPVGKDGYVPLKEIVRRYQEIGDLRKLKTATDSVDDALFG